MSNASKATKRSGFKAMNLASLEEILEELIFW